MPTLTRNFQWVVKIFYVWVSLEAWQRNFLNSYIDKKKQGGSWRLISKLLLTLQKQAFIWDRWYFLARICCYIVIIVLVAKSCQTLLPPHGLYPARLLCPWDFPAKTTELPELPFLLQGMFPTLGSNLRLLRCQADCLPLSHWSSSYCDTVASNQ